MNPEETRPLSSFMRLLSKVYKIFENGTDARNQRRWPIEFMRIIIIIIIRAKAIGI